MRGRPSLQSVARLDIREAYWYQMLFLSILELRVLTEPGDVDVLVKFEAARAYLSVAGEYERGHQGVITLRERSRVAWAAQSCNPPTSHR